MSSTKLDPAKVTFIEDAIASGVLLFGTFELKSGRVSPYFFNAGLLHSSSLLSSTSSALAQLIAHSRIPEFDVLFGPAYKGIPLAAVTCVALKRDYGRECGFGYNRKEVKDHGEGGSLVGAPLRGRIVIIDDVLTSGKAIREAIDIIAQYPEAQLVGVAQLVDRQETGKGASGKSTVQEVEEEFGIPVEAVLTMANILDYLREKGGMEEELKAIEEYDKQYGIKK
ncbi:orotidine monophosphate pyrophosphorylase [Naematelia encephala]|uniref:orotate phosphoribosyltransferase n=1 Tax=Naematelia encephala TaxID=71784 RepID=A0A1Y2BA58_9TREE|nr:orotidine monophosphate pyrophosphorylase [Naematelia encephala]